MLASVSVDSIESDDQRQPLVRVEVRQGGSLIVWNIPFDDNSLCRAASDDLAGLLKSTVEAWARDHQPDNGRRRSQSQSAESIEAGGESVHVIDFSSREPEPKLTQRAGGCPVLWAPSL